MSFQLESNYKPRGDQGQAIAKLIKSVEAGNRHQTLLGVTGSGKTFTIANVIRELNRPTLVISHNKTLAAQLYSEFKQFFPKNAVEYFVSYFDYYQPEAYIPRTDTYIEKDSSINEEIERLRLAATSALLTRREATMIAVANFIGLPLLFLSTTMIARAQMPGWMQTAAKFNPVDWGVKAAREVVLPGTSWGTVGFYLMLLLLLSAVTSAWATWTFRAYQRSL